MTEAPLTGHARADRTPHTLAEWRRLGGWESFDHAVRERTPDAVIAEVKDAGLRGRGGAGFPTGVKWGFMPADPDGPSHLLVNGDEMEPGNFKDRWLMEAVPHLVLEGAAIAAWAMRASHVTIFVRDAYRAAQRAMAGAVEEAREAGLIGAGAVPGERGLEVSLHASAGRYICGEETALIEALEGRRAIPREKPPFPAQSGLHGRPTTVNNVETLACVPGILAEGGAAWKARGRGEDGGTKIFGVSGAVRRPGPFEAPMGTPAREVLERAGGLRDGARLAGFLPGGLSSGFLGEEALDAPMDFEGMEAAGSQFGTGMVIVLDDSVCPVAALANAERFFARESCGWCTPCRDGLPWTARLLEGFCRGEGRREHLEVLRRHCAMAPHAFCGHMPGAVMPLESGLDRFADAFEAHLAGGCPWGRA